MTLDYIKKLCTPAYVYFVISIVAFIVNLIQNFQGKNTYCLGMHSCKAPKAIIFVIQFIYIIFWTWILNLICTYSHVFVTAYGFPLGRRTYGSP